jgi:hypothetical protein
MIRYFFQRITDFRRELLISALRRDVVQLYDMGEFGAARAAHARLFDECEKRSSAQCKRMEDGEEYCA